jgi:hypothetical protein
MQGVPGFVLRFVVLVREEEGQLTFVRLSRLKHTQSRKLLTRGKHFGVVLPSLEDESFLARNSVPPHQISLMAFNRWEAAPGIYTGLMQTRSNNGLIATLIAIERLPPAMPFKRACQQMGMIDLNDPDVPRAVALLVETESRRDPDCLSPATPDEAAFLLAQFAAKAKA